jgi:hypothetical protein
MHVIFMPISGPPILATEDAKDNLIMRLVNGSVKECSVAVEVADTPTTLTAQRPPSRPVKHRYQ